jgi:hypothetical protein
MKTFEWEDLPTADLFVDACYKGLRRGNAGDDPLNRLIGVSNQGGFRILGTVESPRVIVITTSLADPDWPDELDHESGLFTYFGDNKSPGTELHDTRRWGNRLLRHIFASAHSQGDRRTLVPPVLVFSSAGSWRDVLFRGLAVPGAEGVSQVDDLVAVWRSKSGQRFQNYKATFTILDVPVVTKSWLTGIKAGNTLGATCPPAFREWITKGAFRPLRAKPSIEIRDRLAQMPSEDHKQRLLRKIFERYARDPFAFEKFAARVARLHLGSVSALEVTRPYRDGGRDAIGLYRVGTGASSITIDFAVEAKCYSDAHAVGVKEMSRLISRLRHRQFGVMVTTSYVHYQAYEEVKEDGHPIVIIAGGDIVNILVANGIASEESLEAWIEAEDP